MKIKTILITGVAVAALSGIGTLTIPGQEQQNSPPFISPLLMNQAMCSSVDGRASRKATFVRLGYAMAQDAIVIAELGDLAPDTLEVISYRISTNSEEAQDWFNRGLAYTFGFNHTAAIGAFKQAQAADPQCAMCYWGEAFAWGPNINAPMVEEAVEPAYAAAAKALEYRDRASATERALIDAVNARYLADPQDDRSGLDAAFADAMDAVAVAAPEDDLVAVIAAEANMDTQAWAYWDATGRLPEGRTARTIELLEGVLDRNPDYPPAIHLYIHITEASSDPFRAAQYADRLAELAPDLGHLVHMPSHTYFRIGRWEQSLERNIEAVAADQAFLSAHNASPLYEFGYFTHNIHFALTSAQMGGDRTTALEMAALLDSKLPSEMAATQPWIQPIKAAPYYSTVQFADPQTILALPDPGEALPYLKGAWHYARGEALSRLGRTGEARMEAQRLEALMGADLAALEEGGVPAIGVLNLSRHTVLARAAAADGDFDTAVDHMEEAVALQESFPYTEPPYWYYPAKQTLAAMVLRSGDGERAEQLFTETLVYSPNNAYAYYGLAEAYRAQGDRRAGRYARRLYRDAWLGGRDYRPGLERL
ncbi:MAG: hypothetical protein AAF683_11450 [Pseudomonadota bacterium]